LDDNISGVAARGTVTFSAATVAGTINLIVGSSKNNNYTIPVTASETSGDIAIAAAALINADAMSTVIATAPTALSTPIFTGTGLNDLTISGTYTGTTNKVYIIEINTAATPDTFNWSDNDGSTWTSAVAMTGSPQLLSNGVSVDFAATTGHTDEDSWTFNATANVLALTAVNAGTEGNFISISYSSTIANYVATITAMTGGATNPVLTNLFDDITRIRYQWIVYPSSFTLTPLTDLLDARWNVENAVMDGMGIMSITDDFSGCQSLVAAKNDQNLVYHCNKAISRDKLKGSALLELDYVIASQIVAIGALRLTSGSDISQYVISNNGARDMFGGAAIASLPFFNTPFYDLPIIDSKDEWADDEMDDLNTAGGFVLGNNITKTNIIAGQVVTTYKTDVAGNDDVSYKYIEYVNTFSQVGEYFFNNLKAEYAQYRITTADVQAGRNMTNATLIGGFLDNIYKTLSSADYVLTPTGVDSNTGIDYMTYFKNNRTVVIDMALGKATVTMIVPIITQLRVIYVTMQMAFSTNS
jgi:phage tail sheath gpL-like